MNSSRSFVPRPSDRMCADCVRGNDPTSSYKDKEKQEKPEKGPQPEPQPQPDPELGSEEAVMVAKEEILEDANCGNSRRPSFFASLAEKFGW